MARPMNRRTALKGLALGAVGTAAVGGPAVASRLWAPAGTGLPPTFRSPLIFHSPPIEPFRDSVAPLPVRTGSDLTVTAAVGMHRFHSEWAPSAAFGYGGLGYLGPVLEAQSGTPTTLRFLNSLSRHVFAKDVDATLHGVSDTDRTAPRGVVHLHGGVTPPRFDGHPEATIRPGEEFVHVYPNRQEAAALWYHDHAMGITRLNVYAGLASMYLLRDRWDTGRTDNPLGLPAGEFELPLMIQEKIFTADGALNARSTPIVPEGSWEGGGVGDVGLVNGVAWPQLEVAHGLYRFRLINAGSFSVWNLFFSNRMRFWVIGNDGGLLDAPVPVTSVLVAPAERLDLLVDFGGLEPGETVVLCNDEPVPGQAAIIGEVPLRTFCRFRVTSAAGFRGSVPRTLRGDPGQPPRLPAIPRPQRERNLTISQPFELRIPPSIMSLNNLTFDSDDIELPRQGAVEQWNLINVTPDPHPIHVHLVNFRILGRQPINTGAFTFFHPQPAVGQRWTPSAERFVSGPLELAAPWEAGQKDTVRTAANAITRIVVRFPTADELGFDPDAAFAAPAPGHDGEHTPEELQGYVWHCHVLDHEDHDMMLRFRTLP
jgi:spore coat protein A